VQLAVQLAMQLAVQLAMQLAVQPAAHTCDVKHTRTKFWRIKHQAHTCESGMWRKVKSFCTTGWLLEQQEA